MRNVGTPADGTRSSNSASTVVISVDIAIIVMKNTNFLFARIGSSIHPQIEAYNRKTHRCWQDDSRILVQYSAATGLAAIAVGTAAVGVGGVDTAVSHCKLRLCTTAIHESRRSEMFSTTTERDT